VGPITSRVRPFPACVVFRVLLAISGEVLTRHVRSIDTWASPIRYVGASVRLAVA
jgi:mRNA interferase MazF